MEAKTAADAKLRDRFVFFFLGNQNRNFIKVGELKLQLSLKIQGWLCAHENTKVREGMTKKSQTESSNGIKYGVHVHFCVNKLHFGSCMDGDGNRSSPFFLSHVFHNLRRSIPSGDVYITITI